MADPARTESVSPDHAPCQAAVQAIYDAAVEAMENPGPLMKSRDYFEYRLGTAGHFYHREGITELIRERDEARWDVSTLKGERDMAIAAALMPLREALVKVARAENLIAARDCARHTLDALDPEWESEF